MNDDQHLREKARELIWGGKLPQRAPDHVWGGPGTGAKCAICGASTTPAEVELEIEFNHHDGRPGRDSYFVHQQCFSMLESERRNSTPGAVSAQTQSPSTGAAAPVAPPGRPDGISS